MKMASLNAIGVVVALFMGSSSQAATDQGASVAAGESVTVPFAPTLGRTLRLHVVVSETRSRDKVEQPPSTTTSDEDMVFTEHNATGYVLRWTTRSVSVRAAPDRQALMEMAEAAGIDKPVLIQTDNHGVPTALLNSSEMRALLASTFQAMKAAVDTRFAAKPQDERDAMRKAFAVMEDLYRNMTDAQLSAVFLKEPRTILGFGGSTLVRGHPASVSGEFALPLVGGKVKGIMTEELRDAGSSDLTVVASTRPDPTETRAAVTAFLKKMLDQLAPDQREQVKAIFDKLPDMTITSELVATLDTKTGLPRHVEYRTGADMGLASGARTEIYSVTD